MSSLPIFLDLKKTNILVAGTDGFAAAKIRFLLELGAQVISLHYEAADIVKTFESEKEKGQIKFISGSFRPEILKEIKLVYLANISSSELGKFLEYSQKHNILLNHIDRPENSSFTSPATVSRGSVTVAISTNGKAPVLARNLRQKIEQLLPSQIGELTDLIYQFRPSVKKLIKSSSARRKFWNKIYSGLELSKLLALNTQERRSKIIKLLGTFSQKEKKGHVLLVGAGPGDPELLTLKAHRALIEADVIIYDKLVSKEVLNLARRDACLIYVGKSSGGHSVSQEEINKIIIDQALLGHLTVRLKGGDPMIFGRAAEEISALTAKNISYEIIPGITAAVGAAAAGSIPLTHRDHSSQVTFATGQLKGGEVRDWTGLAGKGRTIVIYMGIKTAEKTMNDLIRDGFSAHTPIGIIENATKESERRFYGTLERLDHLIKDKDIQSPALLIIGDSVAEAKGFSIPYESINHIKEA